MDKTINEFLCPSWSGDRLISDDNIFSRLSYMFQEQAEKYGRRIGALHLTFSEGISETVSQEYFTTCTERRMFNWKSSKKHRGLYFDSNVNAPKEENIPVSDILNEGAALSTEITENNTMEELDQYIRRCQRKHAYGYGFSPLMSEKFEALGEVNMYRIEDYLLSCKDLPKKFSRAEGIVTPSGLAAPAGTITPIHIEDNKLLSINQLVKGTVKCPKGWVIIDTDPPNLRKFLQAAAKATASSGIRGCPEKEPCFCFHLQKSFFFSIQWLIDHDIKFVIIMQAMGDIVITDTHAFHEIVNFAPNVTIARNLCTNMSFSAFTPDYVECSHKDLHTRVTLKPITQLGHAVWVCQLKNHMVTLRSSVFSVTNAKWIKNFSRDRKTTHDHKIQDLRKSFQEQIGLPKDVPEDDFFIKFVRITEERNRSYTAKVTTRNPEGYSTREIVDALQKVFEPFRETQPIKVVPIVDETARSSVGHHLLDDDGYVDLPYVLFNSRRRTLEPFQVLHFADKPASVGKRTKPLEDTEKVCIPFKKPRIQPKCRLCDCGEDAAHLEGAPHRKQLDFLMRVWLLDNAGFDLQCDSKLECHLCKGVSLKNPRDRQTHLSGGKHRMKQATRERWAKKITPNMYGLDVSNVSKALFAYNNGELLFS